MTESTNASPRRSWWLWTAVGVVVLIVAGVIVWAAVAPRSVSAEPTATPSTVGSPTASASASPAASASATAKPTTGPSSPPSNTGSPIPPELPPVAPNKPAEGADGVLVRLAKVESVQGEAVQPGETSGPALRVTVRITNDTDVELSLRYTAVNLYYGSDLKPAPTVIKPGGDPFYGTVRPGKSATGVYLFTVPKDEREEVTVGVDYKPGQPTVVFKGDFR